MDKILVKATMVAADEGTFEAVVSTATIDRENDVVEPKAMVDALHKWVPLGKKVPLAWNHSTAAEDQIGAVDPATAQAVGDEVVVKGWIDQSTQRGKDAWRLVKSGVLGFSFGFLILEAKDRKGGGRHITALDVFEITATTTPMNGDTRVLGWKAAGVSAVVERMRTLVDRPDLPDAGEIVEFAYRVIDEFEPKTSPEHTKADTAAQEPSEQARRVDPLRKHALALVFEVQTDGLGSEPPPKATDEPVRVPDRDPDELRKYSRDLMVQIISGIEETQ